MDKTVIEKLFEAAETKKSVVTEIARLQLSNIENLTNSRGQTLLHVAAGYGRTNLASYLISLGLNPNTQDLEGQAPLHNACCHGHFQVSSKLIEAGADVNLTDLQGWSPLHFAVARRDNSEGLTPVYWKVIELLLEHGADPYLKSNSGRTCISRIKDSEARKAVRLTHLLTKLKCINPDNSDEISYIVDKYLSVADFFELVKIGDPNIEVLKLVTTPKLLNSRLIDCDNITPLHRAAGYNHLEVAKWFIQEGAGVNAMDNSHRIPLHNAAHKGHVEMIELLVEHGSDINKKDLIGYTPLHLAVSNSCTFTVCLTLIDLGADIDSKCNDGKLAYDLAETEDVREVLKPETLQRRLELIPSSSEQAVYIDMHSPLEESTNEFDYDSLLDELMLDSDSDRPLFTNPMHQIKKILLNPNDRRYQLIKKKMFETVVKHCDDSGGHFNTYEIVSIEHILNAKVWTQYRLMCQRLEIELGPGRRKRNERLLFHGSKDVDKIQLEGFDQRYAKTKGMFGAGLYFAEHSSKSNQYTFGLGQGCKKHSDKSCYICERKLIYAQVALGKYFTSREAMPEIAHAPPKFSSVVGRPESTENLLYPEYVIYNGDQAYPLFVITYKIKL